jgi:hypothetical protein
LSGRATVDAGTEVAREGAIADALKDAEGATGEGDVTDVVGGDWCVTRGSLEVATGPLISTGRVDRPRATKRITVTSASTPATARADIAMRRGIGILGSRRRRPSSTGASSRATGVGVGDPGCATRVMGIRAVLRTGGERGSDVSPLERIGAPAAGRAAGTRNLAAASRSSAVAASAGS